MLSIRGPRCWLKGNYFKAAVITMLRELKEIRFKELKYNDSDSINKESE